MSAPPWTISHWVNTQTPLTLESLRGRAVLAVAFQMLCPGCVSQGLPQAQRARATFREDDLVVIGLHTVFEHHEAQGSAVALEAFLHEYRIKFPVGIDAQENGFPVTMRAYGMRGTPTTLVYDRAGQLRLHQVGHIEDMALGASIVAAMASEAAPNAQSQPTSGACGPEGCK
ncbi:MAG: TlpA disulfide reductase family protein [Terricaulis sp.]